MNATNPKLLWSAIVVQTALIVVLFSRGEGPAPATLRAPAPDPVDAASLSGIEARLTELERALDRRSPRSVVDALSPDERGDAVGDLARRIAELERRIAELVDARRAPVGDSQLTALAEGAFIDASQILRSIEASDEPPLTQAASQGDEEAVARLLADGIDIDGKGPRGYTPLVTALQNDHEGLAISLMARGSAVDTRDDGGETPLMWAAWRGLETATRHLLDRGAEVNAKSRSGNSALADAARGGHLAVARLLLERGADVHTQDHGGNTPLGLAKKNGHDAVAELLRMWGAR